MTTFRIEITVNRVGGPDGYERSWVPLVTRMSDVGGNHSELTGVSKTWDHLTVYVQDVLPLGDNWYGARLQLVTSTGVAIMGARPVKWLGLAWDVPTYVTVHDPARGAFVIGLRAPEDMPALLGYTQTGATIYPITEAQ